MNERKNQRRRSKNLNMKAEKHNEIQTHFKCRGHPPLSYCPPGEAPYPSDMTDMCWLHVAVYSPSPAPNDSEEETHTYKNDLFTKHL